MTPHLTKPILAAFAFCYFTFSIHQTQAQFGKKLKGLSKKATEKAESQIEPQEEPAIATEFYDDINATDNFREQEKMNFGNIYDFDANESIEFSGYENIQSLDKKEEALQKLSKLKADFPKLKYRRSSLYTMMVQNTDNPHWNVISRAFGNTKIIRKFNDHNVGPYQIESENRGTELSTNIDAYLSENQVAKKLVARWFNRSKQGGFDMKLVSERGHYNASDLDINMAKSSQRGLATLGDAGEELINNTFVIVNDYKFISKEELTEILNESSELTGKVGMGKQSAKLGAFGAAASIVAKGYLVITTSYLYRLNWNDSIASVFYNQYWTEDEGLDTDRKNAFENSSIFSLKKIGFERAWADVQSTVFSNKSNPELIDIATVKATDKAIAKLQRKYDEFKTMTPLYSTEPLTAKIGSKEGLSKGDKFEVLEQIMDSDGRTQYKKRGTITVDEDNIWNNVYLAKEEAEAEGNEVQQIEATQFKGQGKNFYPGMLIRQIN